MIYYVSVARRKRRSIEADIELKILQIAKFLKKLGFEKIEKNSKNDLQS